MAMAIGQVGIAAVALTCPGLLAFLLAVMAENKKSTNLTTFPDLVYDPVANQTTCYYPKDPTIALALLSVVFLSMSAGLAVVAFYFPYEGKRLSTSILWRSMSILVFTILSLKIFLAAEVLLMWAIIVESSHHRNNVHQGLIDDCPSAKAGLFGGAGFLALDATLFFLIVLMLTTNVRLEYFADEMVDAIGSYREAGTYHSVDDPNADRV